MIDFTARQFWHDSPWPLVERIDDYSRRFERLTDEEGHELNTRVTSVGNDLSQDHNVVV